MASEAVVPARVRHAVAAAVAALGSLAAPHARAAEVNYLSAHVLHADDKQVAVRAGIEIQGGAQRWFRVFFQLLRDEVSPLSLPGG